ncbi:MAG: DEAD/DEAH box helicase [Clostridia bacterium]
MSDSEKNRYAKYNKYGDSDFSWQKKCTNMIKDKHNVILSSPTGSGKTKVFLDWAQEQTGKPIIITAPIKALSNQRYRELKDQGYTVGLETGDIKNVPENCDFICCTQEIYTNKYTELEDATLIMDEFHYIFENSSRARTYIDSLYKSKANNILLCSATLGDIDKLTKYVEKVSNRDFFAYENDSRLTSLSFEGDINLEEIKNSLIVTFSKRNIEEILNDLSYDRDNQNEKNIQEIKELAINNEIENEELIEYAEKGISGYYGGLLPKEKIFIEKCFEQGLIDTVVGTDALALGVNFPVQNVVFAQLAKYYDGPISKNLFEQLAGRAGRKGYFDEGHVYYCSAFSRQLEARGYSTDELYEEILDEPNEDIHIDLTPNIKDILLEKTTVESEAEFIANFSTEEVDKDLTKSRIVKTIKYIKDNSFEEQVDRIAREQLGYEEEDDSRYYDEYDEEENKAEIEIYNLKENLRTKEEEYYEKISRVYSDEYTPEKNCAIFADIVCGTESDDILEKYAETSNFYNMLQFRKYVKSLPKQYRKGLTKINDRIREIDKTAIDGFRGDVSKEEISEELEKEGKYRADNVMTVIKDQEKVYKINERANIIEEQLKIAQEYELEDY